MRWTDSSSGASDWVRRTLTPLSCAPWTDPSAYDRQARSLAEMFQTNFERYAGQVSDEIRSAAPTR